MFSLSLALSLYLSFSSLIFLSGFLALLSRQLRKDVKRMVEWMKKGTGKAALAEAENDFAVATMMREEDLAELFRKTLADINNKRRNRNRGAKKAVNLADLEPHLVPLALGMSQFVPELVAKLGTSAERLHMDYFRYRAFMSTLAQRAAYAVAQCRAARAYRAASRPGRAAAP